MYSDEWKPVMTADTMEEQISAFADLARKQASERDQDIEAVVHNLTHNSYLMKHTTSDVLRELRDLVELYSEEFYAGDANDHVLQYLEEPHDIEFWYDYVYLALAAGLEWAILQEIKARTPN